MDSTTVCEEVSTELAVSVGGAAAPRHLADGRRQGHIEGAGRLRRGRLVGQLVDSLWRTAVA
jgi:hypothetical protein